MEFVLNHPIFFAIPGDINTLTGGYGYDRRLMSELQKCGLQIQHIELSESFPKPSASALNDASNQFASLPDGSTIIVDGLAFGVMDDIAEKHAKRLKLIALCHHPLALESGLSAQDAKTFQKSEQRALSAAQAILVTSHNTARILQQQFDIPIEKITVALPGTDKHIFSLCNGLPPILLTVATLTQRKAHDILIDALAQVAHLPWRARFVGGMEFDPQWVTYLQNKVDSYGLMHRITFVGSVDDISNEYSQADIFVLPSLFEGYGMAFAEALSFGLPIVATRTGAVQDVVPENAGILIPPGNIDVLAACLTQLLCDNTERKQLQQGAQQAAQKLSTWLNAAEIVDQLIREINEK